MPNWKALALSRRRDPRACGLGSGGRPSSGAGPPAGPSGARGVQRLVSARRRRRRLRECTPPGSRRAPVLRFPVLSPYAVSSFGAATMTPSGTVDAGAGYVLLGPWLRVDGTLEYRFGGRFQSSYAINDPAPLAAAGPLHAAGRLRGGVSSLVALVNGYVQLGDYWGVRPFVGAGVGVADNALSGVFAQGFAIAGGGAAAGRRILLRRLEDALRLGSDPRVSTLTSRRTSSSSSATAISISARSLSADCIVPPVRKPASAAPASPPRRAARSPRTTCASASSGSSPRPGPRQRRSSRATEHAAQKKGSTPPRRRPRRRLQALALQIVVSRPLPRRADATGVAIGAADLYRWRVPTAAGR